MASKKAEEAREIGTPAHPIPSSGRGAGPLTRAGLRLATVLDEVWPEE